MHLSRQLADRHRDQCLQIGVPVTDAMAARQESRHIIQTDISPSNRSDGAGLPIAPRPWAVGSYQLGPLPGLDAADCLLMSRFVLSRVAEEQGLVVSLDPSPDPDTSPRLRPRSRPSLFSTYKGGTCTGADPSFTLCHIDFLTMFTQGIAPELRALDIPAPGHASCMPPPDLHAAPHRPLQSGWDPPNPRCIDNSDGNAAAAGHAALGAHCSPAASVNIPRCGCWSSGSADSNADPYALVPMLVGATLGHVLQLPPTLPPPSPIRRRTRVLPSGLSPYLRAPLCSSHVSHISAAQGTPRSTPGTGTTPATAHQQDAPSPRNEEVSPLQPGSHLNPGFCLEFLAARSEDVLIDELDKLDRASSATSGMKTGVQSGENCSLQRQSSTEFLIEALDQIDQGRAWKRQCSPTDRGSSDERALIIAALKGVDQHLEQPRAPHPLTAASPAELR